MTEAGGLPVPAVYSDVESEWRAMTEGAALLDLRRRRSIRVRGSDAREYLHGQTTADVRRMAAGTGLPALVLTAQGRVTACLDLYCPVPLVADAIRAADLESVPSRAGLPSAAAEAGPGEGCDAALQEGREDAPEEPGELFEVRVDAADLERVTDRLGRFVVADDVEFDIEDEPPRSGSTRVTIGVAGPGAAAVLARAGFGEVPAGGSWFVRHVSGGRGTATLFGRGDLRVPLIEVATGEEEAEGLWSIIEEAGAVAAGHDAYEIVRIESGTPLWGRDVDETAIAIEACLDWAIHFDKGCYVGQEVIERTVSRGRVNHRLSLLEAQDAIEPGAVVTRVADRSLTVTARERAVVTSAAVSPVRGPICLAYLPADLARPGETCSIVGSGGEVHATVARWPRAERTPRS